MIKLLDFMIQSIGYSEERARNCIRVYGYLLKKHTEKQKVTINQISKDLTMCLSCVKAILQLPASMGAIKVSPAEKDGEQEVWLEE
jgi:hypothetical protein